MDNLVPLPIETLYPSFDQAPKKTSRDVGNLLVSDSILQIYAWKKLVVENITAGVVPLLNPYIFSVNFLLANGQSGVFYIGNISLILFGMVTGWKILFLLQFLMAAFFMFLYLLNLKISRGSAIFGGIVFGFSGFMSAWSPWTTIGHTILWYPLILLAIDKWLLNGNSKWVAIGSLSIACMIFAGHLQFAFYGLMLAFFYSVFRVYQERNCVNKTGFLGLLLVFLIGIGLAAVQLVPTYSAVNTSSRLEALENAQTSSALPWRYALAIIIPSFFGWPNPSSYFGDSNFNESMGYVGLVPLLLTLYIGSFRKNAVLSFYYILLLSSLVLAFNNPVSEMLSPLHAQIFGVGFSGRMLSLFTFAVAVIVSCNLDFLKGELKNGRFGKFIGLLFLTSFFYLVLKLLAHFRHLFFPESRKLFELDFLNLELNFYLFLLLIVSTIMLITYIFRKYIYILPFFLILVLNLDLIRLGHKVIPWAHVSNLTNPPEPFKILRGTDPLERAIGDSIDDSGNIFTIPVFNGYDSISPKSYRNFISSNCSDQEKLPVNRVRVKFFECADILRRAGLKYIVDRDDVYLKSNPVFFGSQVSLIYKGNMTKIYEVKNYQNPFFSAGKPFSEKEIRNLKFSGNEIVFSANLAQSKHLTVYVNYLDGWLGYIDKKRIKIQKSPDGFLDLQIPSGLHDIKLIYLPDSFIQGMFVSFASLIVLLMFQFRKNT